MRLFLLPLALCATSALAQDVHVKVDPNGGGSIASTDNFPTIQNALDHHPFAPPGYRVVISIAPGVYHERIVVTQNHSDITLIGLGRSPEDVVITNSLNAKTAGGTYVTETAEINGTAFEADNLTFENAAGNTGQAVAIAVRSDRAVFKHVRFLGHQDTLFADYGRQYYVDSYIEGGVDFIFGNAAAVFDRCEIHANGPGYLTAQSRTDDKQSTGYVITHSRVTTSLEATPPPAAGEAGAASTAAAKNMTALGRPWRPFSRVVVMHTELPAQLNPAGYTVWKRGDAEPPQAYYAEYQNSGDGWQPEKRVSWEHMLTAKEAAAFEPRVFLRGSDKWDAVAAAAKLP
ncbi:pectinesterase family protein [Granulicella paludicola]|uniref:pectinesterase family protein n=1 Tax=Granulicella paludicola TaxID=474951 RepID=UPI0021DF4BF4|nr:pectinesterase family protein [Granulicella paludicola]